MHISKKQYLCSKITFINYNLCKILSFIIDNKILTFIDASMITKLNAIYIDLLFKVNMDFTCYLYEQINWDNRLIMIKGVKSVGKTTMLHVAFPQSKPKILWVYR